MNTDWSYMRQCLADVLFRGGAVPASALEECARAAKWSLRTFATAADSLGVEAFENGDQTWWRLPKNVVPFRRAHAVCSPAVNGTSHDQ